MVPPVSLFHEAPLEVLRREPRVALELLRWAGRPLDSAADVELSVIDSELTEARPAVRRADWIAVVKGRDGRARAVLVLEVQTARRSDKPRAWLLYIAHLAVRFRAPVWLVVLTFDERVARWADRERSGPAWCSRRS